MTIATQRASSSSNALRLRTLAKRARKTAAE